MERKIGSPGGSKKDVDIGGKRDWSHGSHSDVEKRRKSGTKLYKCIALGARYCLAPG